jgi:hypothetical protein
VQQQSYKNFIFAGVLLVFPTFSLMFFQANEGQAGIIKDVIKSFESSTGQLINLAKCSIMFGSKCPEHEKVKVLEILQVANTAIEGNYLGLPTPKGRMSKNKFKSTKEKLVNKCTSWAEEHMSMEAKEVLIKSVAQAIPTYTMGVFKLPSSTCEELSRLIRKFGPLDCMGKASSS